MTKAKKSYWRIGYSARLMPGSTPWRTRAVFVTGDYRTPEGAIRGLRAMMRRDARVHGHAGSVDVEILSLRQSSEAEHLRELRFAMELASKLLGEVRLRPRHPDDYEREVRALRSREVVKRIK